MGTGYDQSPTRKAYRNVQLPDQDHFILAVGAHYQLNKRIGLDAGWEHFFVKKAKINVTQPVAGEHVTTIGSVQSDANVLGMQVVWNITD